MENVKRALRIYRKTINPPYKTHDYLVLAATLFLLFAIPFTIIATLRTREPAATAVSSGPVRGVVGDLWADIIIGKPKFSEIVPNTVVPNKLLGSRGVLIDNTGSSQKLYIWDGSNNRVLGFDWETCLASETDPANCSADLVIGQPDMNSAACNGDSGFQNFPERAPASASSLCGMHEVALSPGEGGSASGMQVDSQGNLYVTDIFNSRVLKYERPFETDTIADAVWGQDDFTGNTCNKGQVNNPDATTLCLFNLIFSGGRSSGVDLDAQGSLWVVDDQNNRVLRFPKDPTTGQIAKTADIVLGQSDFNSRGVGSGLNQLKDPSMLRINSQDRIYVYDAGNRRTLIFEAPFSSGMDGKVFGTTYGPIEFDPTEPGHVWITDMANQIIELWDEDTEIKVPGRVIGTRGDRNMLGNIAQFAVDSAGNILATASEGARRYDVMLFKKGEPTNVFTKRLFGSFYWGNEKTDRGLVWGKGVAVANNQLVVADYGRLMFWNDLGSLTNGKPADGYAGTGVSSFTDSTHGCCGWLSTDKNQNLWVSGWGSESNLELYKSPLTIGAQPTKTITYPLPILGGGVAEGGWVSSAPTENSEFIWLSQSKKHRVVRVRDPLTNPVVDVILGQTSPSGVDCNRGGSATLSTLCWPGAVALDRLGNVYVQDHALEVQGNFRLLVFNNNLFPLNNTEVIYAPEASKVFPNLAAWQPAFDSQNRMVIGFNGYGPKPGPFYAMYSNPLSDSISYDYLLNDFFSHGYSAAFDENDNLYVGDLNRGRVLIYKQPFVSDPPPPDTEDPTISITSPANGTTVSGTIDVTAAASDNVGVTKVEFYVDGVLESTDTTSPYFYGWDTTKVVDGGHTLLAKAYDASGNTGTDSVSVTVDNSPDAIPGDLDGDSRVDVADLSILLSNWGNTGGVADINTDGKVDVADLSILLSNWT